MNFSEAFDHIRVYGTAMRLPQWKSDVKIKVQHPEEGSKMTAPYLYVESRHGKVPWKETMIELFSGDWQVVGEQEVAIHIPIMTEHIRDLFEDPVSDDVQAWLFELNLTNVNEMSALIRSTPGRLKRIGAKVDDEAVLKSLLATCDKIREDYEW